MTGPGSLAGSLAVSAGGNANPGNPSGTGTLTVGAVTIGPSGTFINPGASFNLEFNGAANTQITVTSSGA